MPMKKAHLALVAAFMLAAPFMTTVRAQTAKPVVIGTDVDAGTLDPRLTRDTTAYRTTDLIYSGLVHLTPTLEPKPDLAESWRTPIQDLDFQAARGPQILRRHAADRRRRRLHLHDSARSVDSTRRSARSIRRSPSVEAVDPQTVQVHALGALRAAAHLSRSRHCAEEAASKPDRTIGLKPVGAGPMKLVSWTRGSEIALEANPNTGPARRRCRSSR